MASINVYHGKKGDSYQITVYNGYDSNGKQIKETITYKPDPNKTKLQQKKEVEAYAIEFEEKVQNGRYCSGDKIKFKDFVEKWKKDYAEDHYSASTMYSYTNHLNAIIIPNLGNYKMTKITPLVLQTFYNELAKDGSRVDGKKGSYSRGTISKYHKIIASIMKRALYWQVIESNPCERVEIPMVESKSKQKYFNVEQANLFLEMLENPLATQYATYYERYNKWYTKEYTSKIHNKRYVLMYKTLFRLALFSGARIGELSALTWEDIDFDENAISINKAVAYGKQGMYIKTPKTETSNRIVVIPQDEINLLRQLRVEQRKDILRLGTYWKGKNRKEELDKNYVFTQIDGSLMAKSSANRVFQRMIENYNQIVSEEKQIPVISIHGLRHTSATLLIANNVDVKTVSERLGHKQIGTTLNIYTHALKERDENASNVLDTVLKQNHA